MRKLLILSSVFAIFISGCSDDSVVAVEPGWTRQDLIGTWYGQLTELHFRPDTTTQFWHLLKDNQAYNRTYTLKNLQVQAIFADSFFSIGYTYNSDSLYYLYEERGTWQLSGEFPPRLLIPDFRIDGRIEIQNGSAWIHENSDNWRADIDLVQGDLSGAGFESVVLRLVDIECSIEVDSLRLEKTTLN